MEAFVLAFLDIAAVAVAVLSAVVVQNIALTTLALPDTHCRLIPPEAGAAASPEHGLDRNYMRFAPVPMLQDTHCRPGAAASLEISAQDSAFV